MEKNIQLFVTLLEKKYGDWNKNKALFGSTQYGKIASDLSISSSLFSKLLYGSATSGMYERTLNNINRLIQRESIEKAFNDTQIILRNNKKRTKIKLLIASTLFLTLGIVITLIFGKDNASKINSEYNSHPLEEYFYPNDKQSFDSPFLSNSDVLNNCPCIGFEGRWVLSKPFKLPLPGSKKPGLYYQAKSADLILRCTNLFDDYINKGKAIIGYEHLKSELWIDSKQQQIVPKFFILESKTFTMEFDKLEFENNKRFIKIADLSAFNVNMFEINGDSISRKAELSGRLSINVNEKLAEKYQIDVNYIVKNILGDLTKANCETIFNPYCNPNDLSIGSILSFNCIYNINEENLGLQGGYPYTKTFSFSNQEFSDYVACDCEDSN
jgi:hypothetical protein